MSIATIDTSDRIVVNHRRGPLSVPYLRKEGKRKPPREAERMVLFCLNVVSQFPFYPSQFPEIRKPLKAPGCQGFVLVELL